MGRWANWGLFSILALDRNPHLHAVSIEASTDHYQVLCRNWRLQPERWLCLHTAVGEKLGAVQITRNSGGYDHVLETDGGIAVGEAERRPITTLDNLAEQLDTEKIDGLKLDIEGMELPALRGASRLLSQHRIEAVVSESDRHEQRYGLANDDLVAFMVKNGYHLDPTLTVVGQQANNCQVFLKRPPA